MKLISAIIVVLALIGCTTLPDGSIPRKIQTWAEANVWQVDTDISAGSGFWLNQKQFLTNCHVVDGREETVTVQNNDRSLVLPMVVSVCDKDADIALLEYIQGDEPFTPEPTIIADKNPDPGQILYGPGYPMAGSMIITTGHFAGEDIRYRNRIVITTTTIFGDSGSPAIYTDWKGRVVVAGIRSGLRGFRSGYGTFFVTHIVTIKDAPSIQKFLRDNA